MDLTYTGWEDVDQLNLDHDWRKWRAVVNIVMDPRAPKNTSNFSDDELYTTSLKRTLQHEVYVPSFVQWQKTDST